MLKQWTTSVLLGVALTVGSGSLSAQGNSKVVVVDPEKNLVVVTRWCEDVSGVVDLAAQAVGSS